MSTLIIRTAQDDDYVTVPLLTTMNLDEHEVIFISPAELYSEMDAQATVIGDIQNAVVARLAQILKWVERGHTLIVLGLSPASYQWQARGNNVVTKTGIEQLTPFNKIKLTAKSGKNIRSAPVVAPILDPITHWIGYQFVIQGPNLIPLMFVKTVGRNAGALDIVAGAVRQGEGFVVFAPDGRMHAYWEALERLPTSLTSTNTDFPSWIDDFRTGSEQAAFTLIASRKAELVRLQAELSQLNAEVDEARQLKQLFVGTGASFEAAVATALGDLGLEVTTGPHPRADLLATNGHRVAAIEAKGVEGAAKEDYVRQVMMWMPEVDAALAMETELASRDQVLQDYKRHLANLNLNDRDKTQDCKGILVLGTFRVTPLDQRTQPDFPENVKSVMIRQDICALTGLQLFALMLLSRSDAAFKEQIKQALFTTRGVLQLGLDWAQVLERAAEG